MYTKFYKHFNILRIAWLSKSRIIQLQYFAFISNITLYLCANLRFMPKWMGKEALKFYCYIYQMIIWISAIKKSCLLIFVINKYTYKSKCTFYCIH